MATGVCIGTAAMGIDPATCIVPGTGTGVCGVMGATVATGAVAAAGVDVCGVPVTGFGFCRPCLRMMR